MEALIRFNPVTGNIRDETAENDKFVNLKIAHAGLRTNNVTMLIRALEYAGSTNGQVNPNQIIKALQNAIKPSKTIRVKTPPDPETCFRDLQHQFSRIPRHTFNPDLDHSLLEYRVSRVNALITAIDTLHLTHIHTKNSQINTTCLFIRFFPHCTNKSSNYEKGVTKALIAVFSGILQKKLANYGLLLRAERRQSFGALRPTLTDAGNLTMRLSLGLEPVGFDAVVKESLAEMDTVLETYNFDQVHHPLVAELLKIKDFDSKKKNQHNFIRASVNSDYKELTSFNQAQAYFQHDNTLNPIQVTQRFFVNYILQSIKLPLPTMHSSQSNLPSSQATLVIALLKNMIMYAKNFSANLHFNPADQTFTQSFLHGFKKLYKNIAEAQELLNDSAGKTADTIFYQATRLIENTIEYLIVLNTLDCHKKMATDITFNPIAILHDTELRHCRRQLKLDDYRIQLFFADSGQQAINVPLTVFGHALLNYTQDITNVNLFDKTYFEVASFFKDLKNAKHLNQYQNLSTAKIVVVDITLLYEFTRSACPDLKVCLIDITHYPDFSHQGLQATIKELLANDVTVVIASSNLKHEQLGLDKFQSGKFFVIYPSADNRLRSAELIEEFESVSAEAMPPALASALQLFHDIGGVKSRQSYPETPRASQMGLFSGTTTTDTRASEEMRAYTPEIELVIQ